MLNATTVAIVAALIAMLSSLVSLAINLSATVDKEIREANRKRFAPLLEDLGRHLYGIVQNLALLNKKGLSSKDRRHFNEKVHEAQKNLRLLRPRLRYPLWGFDDAVKLLILLPGFVKHAQGAQLVAIIDRATALRRTMDMIIRRCFQYGRSPRYWERILLWYRCKRLSGLSVELKRRALEPAQIVEEEPSNRVPKNKVKATVVAMNNTHFTATTSAGESLDVNRRCKHDKRSSSQLAIGVAVYLFKLDGDRDLHYSFVRTSEEIKQSLDARARNVRRRPVDPV